MITSYKRILECFVNNVVHNFLGRILISELTTDFTILGKRIRVDGGDAVGDVDVRQISAITERLFADGGEASGERHARQLRAP